MDFYNIKHRSPKEELVEIYPDFRILRSKDLMVRSKGFYAVWNEETGLWSTDEFQVQRIIDRDLKEYRKAVENRDKFSNIKVNFLLDASSRSWSNFRNYIREMPDTFRPLDRNLTFANDVITKADYVSKRLPYSLLEGSYEAWDELVSTLYIPEEREKLEWAIGSIIAGEAKDIQKFIVIYGEAGGGKSTVLNVIQKLFAGYYTTFEANALTDRNNSFATEMFKDNPLVAIQHDGNLSKILDNSKLNSIVSHEEITINEKFKSEYSARVNAMLFMGTNEPVKITNAKSGLIRRLIDVRTSGKKVPVRRYQTLTSQIDFELGAIAFHCLEVYRTLGRDYYSDYKPLEMMFETDFFINFVEDSYYVFRDAEYITLSKAFDMYKVYCEDSKVESRLPKYKFRVELQNYFETFHEATRIDGQYTRSVYEKFKSAAFLSKTNPVELALPMALIMDSSESIFDKEYSNQPAQYASGDNQIPPKKWKENTTTLSELDTTKLHYVKVPSNHIVIDFDLKDETGEKSAVLNQEAASKWPRTYAEYSKSQKGIHLHYIYDGDPETLSRIYAPGIEVKVSVGDASIRRALSKCNRFPIAHLNSGLPTKEKKMIDAENVKSERGLRDLIVRNLRKEIHPGTKPSIDFIHKILEDAYNSGLRYDLTQMRPTLLTFAANSTNQAEYCVKLVAKMKFKSDDPIEEPNIQPVSNDNLVFFDVEVFSNLFVVCWKYKGAENVVVRMINPTPGEIEELMKMNLIGFNCRRYDNHILYGRYVGYDNQALFDLSSRIVSSSSNGYFREAYNLSYTDVYDFSSKKQSLKAFEIELGIHHQELGIPWSEPVPEELFEKVAEYCENDVTATEAVFEDRKQDFVARQILAELSGLSLNHTTKAHTAKIIFGSDPKPYEKFVYTDLSKDFPGYSYSFGKSTYRGEDPGEGGYVYAEPGMYTNVALLDVASMHPASIELLNLFGPYTEKYSEIKRARIAIKHKDFDTAKTMLGGVLEKYLTSKEAASDLAYALKIVINIVYGLTSAKFPNPFKDNRNVDNIVAKRGALFMIDLKHALQERDIQTIHIKTDSVKIPNATREIVDFVTEFGAKYGYVFEHEATYDKFCLVNNAVYVAEKDSGNWVATGAEFIHPYVFKTLFSKEPVVFSDLCETKSVTGDSYIYLDMNEGLPDVSSYEKELHERERKDIGVQWMTTRKLNPEYKNLSDEEVKDKIKKGHNYQFVGKVSSFVPIKAGFGGGILYRVKDNKYYAVTGTKGFRWLEASLVESLKKEDDVDTKYHQQLVDGAIDHISEFGDVDWFLSEEPNKENVT